MANKREDRWLPLEEAAAELKRTPGRIKSQMRNGRIQRGVHFRAVGDGKFEINVDEYRKWFDEEKEARKLPFLERVRRSTEIQRHAFEEIAPPVSKPKSLPAASPGKARPKLIPLSVWAEETFGEYAPHVHTLLNWAKNGKIVPIPRKIGRQYFVSPDAEYIDPVTQKIRRMVGGR